MSGPEDTAPRWRVVAGSPSDEELAALVVALTAAAGAAAAAPVAVPPVRSAWAAAAREGRPPLSPGPGAWVGSARPR
ncbi:Acyl-CoA carboxylase epsilon subunit [Friedmanniella luteola]|uniref:Acyl-CoA carboxylase epsilon subunit n=1 Tax=Friedmanniella luteola TaxID=546871 RepID=A0A1H1YJQ2_9ACTN|nr:acyl-CoA carboxylase epsilon subunit [Friedmanniella luteola]SDT21591.1 Acyl-CoA carboxylase epsilon subunit [Friedmanniella luteola]